MRLASRTQSIRSTNPDCGPTRGGASVEQSALAAARRLRAGEAARRREPELVAASRLRSLIEAVLEGADGGSVEPVERCLAPQIAIRARQGYRPSELLAELAEVERAVGELIEASDAEGIGGERWRSAQAVLRHAERYLLREVETWIDKHHDAGRRRMVALLEALPEAVLLVDVEGYVDYANERVWAVFGVEPAEIIGLPLAEALARPAVVGRIECPGHFAAETLRGLAATGEGHVDVFRHENGSAFVRRVVPVGEGGELGRAVITTNVTGLRRQNREAELLAAELDAHFEPALAVAAKPRLSIVRGTGPG